MATIDDRSCHPCGRNRGTPGNRHRSRDRRVANSLRNHRKSLHRSRPPIPPFPSTFLPRPKRHPSPPCKGLDLIEGPAVAIRFQDVDADKHAFVLEGDFEDGNLLGQGGLCLGRCLAKIVRHHHAIRELAAGHLAYAVTFRRRLPSGRYASAGPCGAFPARASFRIEALT